MRLALAQINSTVGDIRGNVKKITDRLDEAKGLGADLVVFPEMAVTGYPPEDLLLKPDFVKAAMRALGDIEPFTEGRHRGRGRHRDGRRSFQLRNRLPRREEGIRFLQAFPPQLRGLRRKPVLPGLFPQRDLRPGRGPHRSEHLRGHVVPGRPRSEAGEHGRRRVARQHLRIPLSHGQGDVPGADDFHPGVGLYGLHRVVQHDGRPGRAGFRRPQRRVQPPGRNHRQSGRSSRSSFLSRTSISETYSEGGSRTPGDESPRWGTGPDSRPLRWTL